MLRPLIDGEIADADLDRMIDEAYATFRHPAVCPLTQLDDNLFLLELFHGPTLAFKDVAMQLLGRLMDHVLTPARQPAPPSSARPRAIPAAPRSRPSAGSTRSTSSSSIPHGRVSEVQRRQMTTVAAPNVHALAVDGTFDDCQNLVKAMFQHARLSPTRCSSRASTRSTGPGSRRRRSTTSPARWRSARPHRPVSFSVPTGNFGDVLAGWVAKRMGLPIERLMIGTNANDILARTLEHGAYELRGVRAHDLALDGHPDLVEFRAAAVRGARPRRRRALSRLMAG